MHKPLTRSPWLISGIVLLVLHFLIKPGSSPTDLIILSAIWTALAIISVTMVVRMIRRGHRGPYSQADMMSNRWRSWTYDEGASRR
jgi:cytochrome bd-type quinol oxidase subunit 1